MTHKRIYEKVTHKHKSAKQSAKDLNISWPENELLCFDVDLNTLFGFNLQIGWPTWMDMGYPNVPTALKKKYTDER